MGPDVQATAQAVRPGTGPPASARRGRRAGCAALAASGAQGGRRTGYTLFGAPMGDALSRKTNMSGDTKQPSCAAARASAAAPPSQPGAHAPLPAFRQQGVGTKSFAPGSR